MVPRRDGSQEGEGTKGGIFASLILVIGLLMLMTLQIGADCKYFLQICVFLNPKLMFEVRRCCILV